MVVGARTENLGKKSVEKFGENILFFSERSLMRFSVRFSVPFSVSNFVPRSWKNSRRIRSARDIPEHVFSKACQRRPTDKLKKFRPNIDPNSLAIFRWGEGARLLETLFACFALELFTVRLSPILLLSGYKVPVSPKVRKLQKDSQPGAQVDS